MAGFVTSLEVVFLIVSKPEEPEPEVARAPTVLSGLLFGS